MNAPVYRQIDDHQTKRGQEKQGPLPILWCSCYFFSNGVGRGAPPEFAGLSPVGLIFQQDFRLDLPGAVAELVAELFELGLELVA